MRVTLGFDTSCYTTSAAAVNEQGEVVAASRLLLPVKQGERGLRQSEAVFAHVRQMPMVMDDLKEQLKGIDHEIVAVCASSSPRDEEDSYMPVFTVGLGHARVLADALDIPLYETSHQQGHIAAGLIGNKKPEGDFGLRDDITSLCHQLGDYTPNTYEYLDFTFDEHAFLIKKGERLRIDIASADAENYVRHTNNKGLYSEQTSLKIANNNVDLGNSTLTLPIEKSNL